MEKEIRDVKVELRVTRKTDGALPKIEGYAARFNSDSEDMGFIERIRPGAFKGALGRSDARALFNHDPNFVLGRMSAGTLELREDKKGLFMSVNPPDTQIVRDLVLTPIERRDITQQSFGFTVAEDSWEGLDTDRPTRTIESVRELFDVSPVTYPAYTDTEVALRRLEAAKQEDHPEIVVTIDGKEYRFRGSTRLADAAEMLLSLRPESNDSGNGADPMVRKSPGNSELLDRFKNFKMSKKG